MKKKLQLKELDLKIKKTEILLVHKLSLLAISVGAVFLLVIVLAIILTGRR